MGGSILLVYNPDVAERLETCAIRRWGWNLWVPHKKENKSFTPVARVRFSRTANLKLHYIIVSPVFEFGSAYYNYNYAPLHYTLHFYHVFLNYITTYYITMYFFIIVLRVRPREMAAGRKVASAVLLLLLLFLLIWIWLSILVSILLLILTSKSPKSITLNISINITITIPSNMNISINISINNHHSTVYYY